MTSLLRRGHFLGSKLRALRKRNNLTLDELSARCVQLDPGSAPSVSYLSMVETGKRTRLPRCSSCWPACSGATLDGSSTRTPTSNRRRRNRRAMAPPARAPRASRCRWSRRSCSPRTCCRVRCRNCWPRRALAAASSHGCWCVSGRRTTRTTSRTSNARRRPPAVGACRSRSTTSWRSHATRGSRSGGSTTIDRSRRAACCGPASRRPRRS